MPTRRVQAGRSGGKNEAVTPASSPTHTDAGLRDGVRAGEPAAIVAWVERDHPIAEFVCTVAADGGAPGTVTQVLAAAWRAALGEVGAGTGEGGLRTVLLREVLYALDDAGRLDTATPDAVAPVPGPYLPAGDPWEGWWADDDAVPPLAAAPRRDQVVAALRQLPLGLRVLLVLRDGAGLPAQDAADLVAGSADQQDALLGTARVGFICLIDEQIGEGRP